MSTPIKGLGEEVRDAVAAERNKTRIDVSELFWMPTSEGRAFFNPYGSLCRESVAYVSHFNNTMRSQPPAKRLRQALTLADYIRVCHAEDPTNNAEVVSTAYTLQWEKARKIIEDICELLERQKYKEQHPTHRERDVSRFRPANKPKQEWLEIVLMDLERLGRHLTEMRTISNRARSRTP